MAYAVGHVSGGHFNPAVTLGAALAGRLPWKLTVPYWIAQLVGGVAAGGVLLAIASGRPGYSLAENGLATNGYGELSPAGYSMGAVFLTEVLLTAVFLYVILGATDRRAPSGFAPLAIGLTLTLIHLISIPVSNTSVNPARSFGVALFAGGDASARSGCSSWPRCWAPRSPVSATASSSPTPVSYTHLTLPTKA